MRQVSRSDPALSGWIEGGHRGHTQSRTQPPSPSQDDLLSAEEPEARGDHLDRVPGRLQARHPDPQEDGHWRPGEARPGPGPEPGQGHAQEEVALRPRTPRAQANRQHPPPRFDQACRVSVGSGLLWGQASNAVLVRHLSGGGLVGCGRARHDCVEEALMPKYVIEREIPNAGKLTAAERRDVAKKSCSVLRTLGPDITWVTSYVTADKIYCVYIAPSEDLIREHARQGGFPANKISEVTSVIDITTAEG